MTKQRLYNMQLTSLYHSLVRFHIQINNQYEFQNFYQFFKIVSLLIIIVEFNELVCYKKMNVRW